MLDLKKTIIFVLAFGLYNNSFSGTAGSACVPDIVTVSCKSTAWDLSIKALYLQPIYDTNWGYYGSTTLPNGGRVFHDLDSDWGLGFQLVGSYHFNTGNDININWYHFDNDTYHNIGLVSIGGTQRQEDFNIQQKWDSINLELGQYTSFGSKKKIRFHGGVQLTRIEHDAGSHAGGFPHEHSQTKFTGVGPRTGLDMSYNWGKKLAIHANAETALLVGSSKFNYDHIRILENEFESFNGSKNTIVPEVGAKLGAKYVFNTDSGHLILDAGYVWLNYFNAQHGLFGIITAESNYALHGPYVDLRWIV
ncbi:TPA: Lpg1974 family pore-forming outer membrane protein [Legionella pneumophila]